MQAPKFCPRTIGTAISQEIFVVKVNACKIPIDAEELCIREVTITPQINPKIGFLNLTQTFP